MVAIQLTFHCDTTWLSCIDEVNLINDCLFFSSFFIVVIVHNKSIYCSGILFEIQTFLGGAISVLFSI